MLKTEESRQKIRNKAMKYYSYYTKEYVQDICNALNNAGFIRDKGIYNRKYAPENFDTLTSFLQNYVCHTSAVFDFLNQKNLVNRGKCPYTGQPINTGSPSWSYFNSIIYLSPEGLKTMQREEDENLKNYLI